MSTLFYSGETTGLKEAIKSFPQGYQNIHEVMKSNSDSFSLEMLYYIEHFPYYLDGQFYSDALVFSNYLRKMLLHPNEYFRAKTLKMLSQLDSFDVLSTVTKPIENNLYHTNEYVRRNAYLAIKKLISYDLLEFEMENLLENEKDPINRYLLYNLIEEKEFEVENENFIILELNCKNSILMEKSLQSKNEKILLFGLLNAIKYEKLNEELLKKYTEKIIEILQNNSNLNYMKIPCLNEIYNLKISNLNVLHLYEIENAELNMLIFNLARKNNKIIEVINLFNFILQMYLKKQDRLITLEMINLLVKDTFYFNNNNEIILQDCLKDSNPEIQYKALLVIEEICKIKNNNISSVITRNLKNIIFGKIIRKTISILFNFLETEELFNVIESFKVSKIWYLNILYEFITNKIKNKEEKDIFIPKIINLLLELNNLEDFRFESLKNLLFRTIIKVKKDEILERAIVTEKPMSSNFSLFNKELKLPNIFNIKNKEELEIKKLELKKEKVVQLSSINDPIYIESTSIILGNYIFVDLVLLNNTSYNLTAKLDFNCSENLEFCNLEEFRIKSNSAKEMRIKFRIKKWMQMFILGEINFFYFEDKKIFYEMNLEPIICDVVDSIIPNHLPVEEFRKLWPKLEWENISTIRKKCDLYKLIGDCKLDKFCLNNLESSIFSLKVGTNVVLGNFVDSDCTSIRLRGPDEELVKSVGKGLTSMVVGS